MKMFDGNKLDHQNWWQILQKKLKLRQKENIFCGFLLISLYFISSSKKLNRQFLFFHIFADYLNVE